MASSYHQPDRPEDPGRCWALIWSTGARIPLTYLPPPAVDQFKTADLAAMERRMGSGSNGRLASRWDASPAAGWLRP